MAKKTGYIVGGIAALALIAGGLFFYTNHKPSAETVNADPQATSESASDSKKTTLDGNTVTYKGEKYKYNSSIKTYLYMGIDKDGVVEEAEDSLSGGQSDAMFLLVNDQEHQKNSIIAINRYTMCPVDVYDSNGNYDDVYTLQICLQHAYGNGLRESCIRTEKAVSRLFYNLPIDGYLSLRMGGIPILNDALGGVEVAVMDDIETDKVSLHQGEVKTLTGDEAYAYLRNRDIEEFGSSNRRQERHIQYMLSMIEKGNAKVGTSVTKALDLYDSIKDYTVTDIDLANISKEILPYGFEKANMYSVPGEYTAGEKFGEFHLDDDKFYELILEVFYDKQ